MKNQSSSISLFDTVISSVDKLHPAHEFMLKDLFTEAEWVRISKFEKKELTALMKVVSKIKSNRFIEALDRPNEKHQVFKKL